MRFRAVPAFALSLCFALCLAPFAASSCGGADACALGEREYHAAPPPDWDGASPLPVLLHFHGWGRRSGGVLKNKRVAAAAHDAGALLVAPQGLGRSWSFWSEDSPDSDFALAVLEDVAKRWPVDEARIFISGFSYGGAMAWRLACDKGAVAAAFLPIAGTLWREDDCLEPVRMAHVHGLKDTVMDYPFGEDGSEDGAVSLWLEENRCGAEPDETERVGVFTCRRWTACGGPPVELCTHPYGHMIPKSWLAYALPRALSSIGK